MLKLKLERPLAVFDIESTGTNRRADRIIDLAIVKIWPDGHAENHSFRVNPGIPIPAEATEIHGISDADVKDCPPFREIAPRVLELLKDCDLGGYNILGFDVPLLIEEFTRVGIEFDEDNFRIVDAQRIYHKRVPRDLPAALHYYCNEMHLGAHDAMEDVRATIRVLEGQFDRYPDLPKDVDGLDAYCNPRNPSWVDRAGKFKWVDGEVVFNFGKKQGQKLRDIARDEPGFLKWMLKSDFPRETLDMIRAVLDGRYPEPPPKNVSN